jgi:hypothetical protein
LSPNTVTVGWPDSEHALPTVFESLIAPNSVPVALNVIVPMSWFGLQAAAVTGPVVVDELGEVIEIELVDNERDVDDVDEDAHAPQRMAIAARTERRPKYQSLAIEQ